MARARTEPEDKAADEPTPEPGENVTPELSGKTVELKYTGPEGQVVIGLPELHTGESYDVPVELADGLVAGSAFWEK